MVNYVALVLSVLLNFLPGLLLSLAFFKHTFFNKWEKLFFGICLSMLALPFLAFLEFLVLGIKFSFFLVFANAVLVSLIALALLAYQKQAFTLKAFKFHYEGGIQKWASNNLVYILLFLVLVSAFYVRFATAFSPTFFEFDPFFYDKVTEKLVTSGFIETLSPEVYYPEQLFLGVPPLLHYLEGSWYVSYATFAGSPYLKENLIQIAQLYPPLAGALLAFLAFMLLKEEYNEYIGLIVAAIFAFMPQLIKKFGSGVSEQQPLGLFALMLVFVLYIIAHNRKSNRFAYLTGFAMAAVILASQQYIWPFMVLTAYIALQSVLDYISGTLDKQFIKTNVIAVAGALVGSFLLSVYGNGLRFEIFSTNILVLLASLAFSLILYGAEHFFQEHHKGRRKRLTFFAGIFLVVLVITFLLPLGGKIINLVQGQLGVAFAQGALGKTIQEEGATDPSFFAPSFSAALNPPLILFLATILASIMAIVVLLERKHRNYAIVFAIGSALLLFLNNQVDAVVKFIASAIGSKPLIDAVNFFASSDIFLYLLISLLATAVYYVFSEKKSRTALLFVLIFFPVAYIGINKVKYLLHLGIAVALAFGYVLGESTRVFEFLGKIFTIENFQQASTYFLYLVLLVGVGVAFVAAQTIPQSMNELTYNRIPGDWVLVNELSPSFQGTPASAMGWLYHNTNRLNPTIQKQCDATYGWDCRVLSWWDYGHWITFFGESNSVLDPNNLYQQFDQEVARSYVNGNPSDLVYTMNYHHATHVLVDSDLIGKWGALVFLSGTCSKKQSPICPDTPEIDFSKGAGGSKYEAEHYFEYLSVSQENCPSSASAVPLPMLKNSYGITYCADNEFLYVLTNNGLLPNYKRRFVLTSNPSSIDNPDPNVSYLIPIGQGQLLNINPDLSYANINNTVFKSAYTQLFFFERLPGFKLAFRSPGGSVRIFEYTGEAGAGIPTPSPSPQPSGQPTALPSLPASNDTHSTNATGNSSNST